MSDLQNQHTVIITGAGRGIGLELVKAFLRDSSYHIIATSRNVDRLDELSNERITIIKGDFLTHYEDILNHIKKTNRRVTILINNAAQILNKNLDQVTNRELEWIMQVNFHTPYKLIRDLSTLFVEGAHIVNISSMSGFQGSKKFKGLSLYSASKAALASLSECVAEEWSHRRIYCNCLSLGSVDTEMIRISIPGLEPSITANDMAGYIYGFATRGHLFYNGQVLPVTLTTL